MTPLGALATGASFAPSSQAPWFRLPDQVGEHVIKEANLFAVEIICGAEKKIGYVPESFGAALARARGENIFELFDDGRGLRHFLSWAGFFLPPSIDWR
jgi:hypothetical protein